MPATQRFTSFDALILAAMGAAEQQPHAAAGLAFAWLKEDEDLYEEVVTRLVKQACLEQCSKVQRNTRTLITGGARFLPTQRGAHPVPTARRKAALLAGVQQDVRRFMDFPLRHGMPLRKATRMHIQETIDGYKAQTQTMEIRTRWLGRVYGALPDESTTVEKALTEEKLREFYHAAETQGGKGQKKKS